MKPIHTKTYFFTLIATLAIFIIAAGFSTYFNKRKTEELKAAESKIAIDILSLETQYELLNESSCKTFDRGPLRQELDTLSSKLEFMEGQLGENNQEVFRLKRYYTLLEIKDYLLTKRMTEQCKQTAVFVMFFYANKNCPECQSQEYMIEAIARKYPQVELYSFDYHLDLAAVKTLINLHNIPPKPPVIDINGKAYASFDSLESLEYIVKAHIASSTVATSTATTTKKVKK